MKIQKNLTAPKMKETKKSLGEVYEGYYKPIKTEQKFF